MKKLALYFVSFCSFFFVGCSDDNSPTPTEFTVTYKSDASTEVGTEKVPVATPTLTKNNALVEGKYIVGFFTDETKMTAFDFSKNLTADVTIYVTFKDIVTPADKVALVAEINNAITEQGNNADLNYINTEKITDMFQLFIGRVDFNGDISEWNVSAVTNMSTMFSGVSAFNGDISKWDVGVVENMADMFSSATAFNGDISVWNVSDVENMRGMFDGATAFNQDISSWEVSSLINSFIMFRNATAFDQDLDAWSTHLTLDDNGKFTSSVVGFKDDMFKGSLREDNPPSWY